MKQLRLQTSNYMLVFEEMINGSLRSNLMIYNLKSK